MMHNMEHFGAGMSWGMGIGWVLMALFFTLLVVGIIALVKGIFNQQSDATQSTPETALNTLKQRYASGAIDQDEFQTRKHHLEQ